MSTNPSTPAPVRFRQNFAVAAAAVVALVGSFAVAAQKWWLAPILLLPLAALWWSIRSGVDADQHRLRIRGFIGAREVPWSEIIGFSVQRGRVLVHLTDDQALRLPAVTWQGLPRLIEASGHEYTDQPREPSDH